MTSLELYPEFIEFLEALNKTKVRYLLIGGYSVVFHGYARSTMDMDIWVERTKKNYQKLVKAFVIFQMPIFDMTEENFLNNEELDVFTFGRPPVSIDILNRVKGVAFLDAWKRKNEFDIEDIQIQVISK